MELHAQGLERLGHRATVLLAEDLVGFETLRDLRLPGARTAAVLRERYQRERPDIVNVHTRCAPAWIGARKCKLVSSKVVVMSYAADEPQIEWRGPRDLLRWARAALPARWSFPRANGIWCVNQQDVEYYVGTYGVERSRIGRFPHAVADSFYDGRGSSTRKLNRLLFVGTWIRRKGVDVLAAALKRVVSALPSVEIVIAGTLCRAGEVWSALDAAVAARTQVIDQANDFELADLYRTSGLLLIPSRREGLPITMLEAMACGCPPLAAANSGMLDVIVPGFNGWLEVSFDEAEWADRIVNLLANPHDLAVASRGAAETAREFHIETVARRVVDWYTTLSE
jgi:glycosyltransferase involved in cell wall biosynthesis